MTLCTMTGPPDPPESDHDIPCCLGEAVWGPERCTCWEPEYDVAQAAPELDGVVKARPARCRDCAYLPGSPEQDNTVRLPGYGPNSTGVFWCHQGMRRVVAWVHPDGRRVTVDEDDYDPPFHGGVPYRADGAKADICAGWTVEHAYHVDP